MATPSYLEKLYQSLGAPSEEQYKSAIQNTMPAGPPAPPPEIGPPAPGWYMPSPDMSKMSQQDMARYYTLQEHIGQAMPRATSILTGQPYAGIPEGVIPTQSPAPRSGYGAPAVTPELPDEGNYRFMGRAATPEELASEKAIADKQAADEAFDKKYFHPERFNVKPKIFNKQMELMNKHADIQMQKADIESKRLENESMIVSREAEMQQAKAQEAQLRDQAFYAKADELKANVDKKVNDVANAEYNPRRIYANMGNAEKAAVVLGAMLGGWQQAMTKSGENQFLKTLDKIAQDDLAQQEHNIGVKKYIANEAKASYQQMLAEYKDRDLVRNMREAQIYKSMQTKIMADALKSGSQTAVKNAEEASNAMQMKMNELEMQRSQMEYFNPDLVKGGGGGGAVLKEAKEGARYASEKMLIENIPEAETAINRALADYENGHAFKQTAAGNLLYEQSPWLYGKVAGKEDVATKQHFDAAFGLYGKALKGNMTKDEKGDTLRTLTGDNTAEGRYRGLLMMKQEILAKKRAINMGISPEAKALSEARGGTNEYKNMPDSTKKAGQ